MNKIEKLIKEMCPNGVEYRKLFQITNILKGQQLNKEKFIKDGEFPVYNGGKTYSGFYDKYNQEENSIILNQGGSAGLVSFIETKFWASAHCFIIKPINQNFINNKFLFYLLKSKYSDISKLIRGTTIPGISIEDLKNFEIPIPPIEIQNEIVKILDTFTQLEAELEAELEARDKQYQYYRNKLLDFDNNKKLLQKLFEKNNKEIDNKIQYSKIEELFSIVVPPSKLKKEEKLIFGKYPIIDQGDQNDAWFTNDFKNILPKSEYILFGDHTTNIKYVDFEFAQGGDGLKILQVKDSKKNLTKYFYYVLQNIGLKIVGYKRHWSILKDILISIPSLEIQRKIVTILDKLQDYSKDIKTGLPLEIEQRQKQYEYYRNLLLDFKANAQGGGISK